MSHQDEPTEGAAPAQKPFSTPRMVELEAELERTRAELVATVDALTDQLDPRVQAARAAGMPAVAAGYGYLGEHPDVHAWQADAIIASPAALLGLLELPGRVVRVD